MTDLVTTEISNGVLTMRLNRPEKLNAMSPELVEGVRDGLVEAAANTDVKVIVLTGNGRAFCAGGDLTKVLDERRAVGASSTISMSMMTVEVFSLMDWMPKPIIASVNGLVYGGGVGFVLYSDLALASETAVLCCQQSQRGLYEPYTITRLASRIGVERAKYMLFTARQVPAAQALEWGLVSEVHPPDQLEAATRELAEQLTTHNEIAMREYKLAVRRSLPGFDLGTFVSQATRGDTTGLMERFTEEFPA